MGAPALQLQHQSEDNTLIPSWQVAASAFKKWQDTEARARKERERDARAAVASCYRFAAHAFADSANFDNLKKELRIEAKANTSRYFEAVKACFGVIDNGTGDQNWIPIRDQLAHKYVKVMDYASFRGIDVDAFEDWLNRNPDGQPQSLSKRYNEAVASTEYRDYCKKLGYAIRDDANPAEVQVTKQQQQHLDIFLSSEKLLEPGTFTPGFCLQIRQVDETGHARVLDLPSGIAGITDAKAIQRLIDKVTEIDPSARGFERLMAILRLASVIKVRKNDTKGRAIELSNTADGMTAKIGRNDAKGSTQIELTYDKPDPDLPLFKTTLTEQFITWVPRLYTGFGGRWEAAEHQGSPAIRITPPSDLSVSGHIAAINAKREKTAEDVAKKRSEKKGEAYVGGKATFSRFYLPPFTISAEDEKSVFVPLIGFTKENKPVRFAVLRDGFEFEQIVAMLDPETIKKIIEKETDVIRAKVDHPVDKKKKISRIPGDLYFLRITHARIAFCDMDGSIVGHIDLPNRIGTSEFRKDYMLAKGTLLTILKELRGMMPNTPVQLEFGETLMRISAKAGGLGGRVLLPAATSAYSGDTTAFAFEKPE